MHWLNLLEGEVRHMGREGIYKRKTRETDVEASICLDGSGGFTGGTGFGFFDHMLEELAFHGMFDISLSATGDATGNHHLCEDAGICLGRALAIALKGADEGGGPPITRFGWSLVPMDGSLARAALDLSGRGGAWQASTTRSSRSTAPSSASAAAAPTPW